MKRIVEFDGIRALAVGLVIADHYAPFRDFAGGFTARYGGMGVDVFFVLSGFLITGILRKTRSEPKPFQVFYARRFLRILPPYILLLLFVYGMGAMFHESLSEPILAAQLLFLRSFKDSASVVQHLVYYATHLSAVPGLFHYVAPGAIAADYGRLPMTASLGPTWSLSVEEWFYVLWAPVVLLFSRRTVVVVAGATCVSSFMIRWVGGGGTNFFTSVDILVLGALLALWLEERPTLEAKTRARIDFAISAAACLAFAAVVAVIGTHRDTTARTFIGLAVFGGLAWIVRNTGGSHAILRFFRLKPLVYIGSISYTIYLFHLPFYFVVRKLTDGMTSLTTWERMWVVATVSITATLLFSALSWKYYEGPVLGLKDSITDRLQGHTEKKQEKKLRNASAKSEPEMQPEYQTTE